MKQTMRPLTSSLRTRRKGLRYAQALALYLVLVAGHFAEHLSQLAQVYLFGLSPREAGGLLGVW